MIKNIRAIGLCALVALCAVASAQDALNLKFSPKVGDTMKYKLTGSLETPQGPGEISGVIEDKVTKADADGYTVTSSQNSMNVTFGGSSIPIPDSSSTSVFKLSGEVVDLQADQVTGDTWRVAELDSFIYPDKPVKVGDTWTSSVTADSKKGTVAGTTNYKVDSLEKIGSHDTAKIKVTYKETSGDSPASSDGYVWIDTKDGSMVKAVSTWSNVPMGPMPVGGTITLERQD